MGFLTAEALNASWTPEEESSQINTQRRLRRWNAKPGTNFSRVFNSLAAKISNVFLASWLAFSAAVSNARLHSTLTLKNVYFILYIHLFLPLYASENLGFATKGIETPSDCFAFFYSSCQVWVTEAEKQAVYFLQDLKPPAHPSLSSTCQVLPPSVCKRHQAIGGKARCGSRADEVQEIGNSFAQQAK